MFQAVAPGGDAYILSHILHDWADADAIRILRNCRQAMAPTGRILAVELVVAPANQPDFGKCLDLHILVLLGACERTETDFRDLYAAAGFRLARIIPTGGRSIIEGVPA
jgi:hypothetical protein